MPGLMEMAKEEFETLYMEIHPFGFNDGHTCSSLFQGFCV